MPQYDIIPFMIRLGESYNPVILPQVMSLSKIPLLLQIYRRFRPCFYYYLG